MSKTAIVCITIVTLAIIAAAVLLTLAGHGEGLGAAAAWLLFVVVMAS